MSVAGNGTGVGPGRSLLGDLAEPALTRTSGGYLIVLRSGERDVALDPAPPEEVYGRRLEVVWGERRVLFADGTAVLPADVVLIRPATRRELEPTRGEVVAFATRAAADELKTAAAELKVAAEAVSGGVDDDLAAWSTDELRAAAERLRASPTRTAEDSIELAALSGELLRRGAP